MFRSITLAIAGFAMPLPVLAEPDYCYDGDPPPGVTVETAAQKPDPVMQAIISMPLLFRSICGQTGEDDDRYLTAYFSELGCSETSDLAQRFRKGIAPQDPSRDLKAEMAAHPDAYAEFCRLVGDVALPDSMAGVQAMLDSPEMARVIEYNDDVLRKLPKD